MISLEKRKEIFNMYFIEFHSIRKISSELNISRSTVTKIINDCKDRLKELDLLEEDNLSKHINSIVIKPKMKRIIAERYKVKQEHIDILEELIQSNEKIRTRRKDPKEWSNLPDDFYTKIEDLEKFKDNDSEETTISISTYYKLAREIKDRLGIPYSKRNRNSKKNKKNMDIHIKEVNIIIKK